MRDLFIGLLTIVIIDPYRGLDYDAIQSYTISTAETIQCAIVWCNQDACDISCLGDEQEQVDDSRLDNIVDKLFNYVEVNNTLPIWRK